MKKKKWEYRFLTLKADDNPNDHLDSYGDEGFELVSVVRNPENDSTTFYFKREIVAP